MPPNRNKQICQHYVLAFPFSVFVIQARRSNDCGCGPGRFSVGSLCIHSGCLFCLYNIVSTRGLVRPALQPVTLRIVSYRYDSSLPSRKSLLGSRLVAARRPPRPRHPKRRRQGGQSGGCTVPTDDNTHTG